jgi:hypothetical protein
MRACIAVIALLAGCTNPFESSPNLDGKLTAAYDLIDRLEKTNTAQTVEISALLQRSAPERQKIPHLIALAGSAEEQDLGPFVDWEHAYSAQLDGYYYIGYADKYLYESNDCTGKPWGGNGYRGQPTIGADGTIVIPGAPDPSKKQILSARSYGVACAFYPFNSPGVVWTFTDTGIAARPWGLNELSAALR